MEGGRYLREPTAARGVANLVRYARGWKDETTLVVVRRLVDDSVEAPRLRVLGGQVVISGEEALGTKPSLIVDNEVPLSKSLSACSHLHAVFPVVIRLQGLPVADIRSQDLRGGRTAPSANQV